MRLIFCASVGAQQNPKDALATATALTAETIARSYARFVRPQMKGSSVDFLVSGGGARNGTLMAMLAARLEPLGCELAASEEFGMPAEAKEAAAFALLAWQTWHRLPGNLPSATGARARGCAGTGYVCVEATLVPSPSGVIPFWKRRNWRRTESALHARDIFAAAVFPCRPLLP